MHGLSCRWSEGRHFRHSALNDIVHRALSSSRIPSRLDPYGISRSDGKQPDGITLVPWERGKLLVWDVTYTDTFAPSFLASAASEAGAVAALAEERKKAKYQHLDTLVPFAVETTGVFGERLSHYHLTQCVSVTIQRGNAASVMGTSGHFYFYVNVFFVLSVLL